MKNNQAKSQQQIQRKQNCVGIACFKCFQSFSVQKYVHFSPQQNAKEKWCVLDSLCAPRVTNVNVDVALLSLFTRLFAVKESFGISVHDHVCRQWQMCAAFIHFPSHFTNVVLRAFLHPWLVFSVHFLSANPVTLKKD